MQEHKGILDLQFGELWSIWNEEGVYNTAFVTSGFRPNIPTKNVVVIKARDFLLAAIGSSEFSERQRASIHKIYLEYKDQIDIRRYKDYIISNRDYLLQEKDIKAGIELLCLFELVNENSDAGGYDSFIGNQTKEIAYVDISMANFMVNEEGKRIISKLNMSVFKKQELTMNPEKAYLEYVSSFCKFTKMELSIRNMLCLVGHGSKYDALSKKGDYKDETYFLSSKIEQKRLAEEIIRKFSKPKDLTMPVIQKHMKTCSKNGICDPNEIMMLLLGDEYLTPAAKSISRHFSQGVLELLDSYRTIDQVIGNSYKPDSVKTAEEVIKVYQMANSAACITNLSLRILKDVKNKDRLMKRAIYIAANFSETKEKLISQAMSVFLQLGYIELVNEARNEKIEMVLQEMVNEVAIKEKFNELEEALAVAKSIIQQKELALERANAEIRKRDSDALHVSYNKIIGERDKEILRLQEKIDKLSSKVEGLIQKNNELTIQEDTDADIDISHLNILYIGNEESQKNIPELEKYVSKVKYINGEKKSSDITNTELIAIDVMLLQTEYVPHTTKKFKVAAKNNNIPMFTLDGTNIELWIKDLKKKYQMYKKYLHDTFEN